MSYTELRFLPFIIRLREHFHEQRYSFGVTQNYPVAVRRFLRNLERCGRRVESVTPADVESYLDTAWYCRVSAVRTCCGTPERSACFAPARRSK